MSRFLAAVFALVLVGPACANEIPAGLNADEWTDIQQQVVQAQYHAHQSDAGFEAHNRAHGFHAQFATDGTTAINTGNADIQFRLIGDNAQPQSITTKTNTVTYQWDDTIREWWVNDENGLEQWFEVAERPSTNQPLALNIELQTTLAVSLANNQLLFSDENTALTYDKLIAWDATGTILPSHMSLNDDNLILHVDDSSAKYPITIDPTLSQQAYVKASNTEGNDRFGSSVAVSGNTVVVGAFFEDSNATGVDGNQADNSAGGSGAAYVFTRSGTTWSQQAYLKASNTETSDSFGWAVAIDGDTVVVGARLEASNATGVDGNQADNSANGSGAAYVFTRSGTTWSQQAYLKASNSGAGDQFGFSVALDNDTLVVGAISERSNATGVDGNQADNSANGSGAAYVFTRSGSTWSQQAYLKASNTGLGDQFGEVVAVDGDTVVVGAGAEDSNALGVNGNQVDNSATSAGAAYVFSRSGTLWTQQAYLKASNTEAFDEFGRSLGIANETIIVGAAGEDSDATGVDGNQANNSAVNSGAAYVFTRSGTTWSQQAYLKASNTGGSDNFGFAVAMDGDSAVVSARSEDSNAIGVDGDQANNASTNSGAAYIFNRSGTTWGQLAYLKASNTGNADSFGYSAALDGDTVVVGANFEDSNATGVDGNQANSAASNSGAAYIFTSEPDRRRRIIVTGN